MKKIIEWICIIESRTIYQLKSGRVEGIIERWIVRWRGVGRYDGSSAVIDHWRRWGPEGTAAADATDATDAAAAAAVGSQCRRWWQHHIRTKTISFHWNYCRIISYYNSFGFYFISLSYFYFIILSRYFFWFNWILLNFSILFLFYHFISLFSLNSIEFC